MTKSIANFVKLSVLVIFLVELLFLQYHLRVSDFEFTDLVDSVLNVLALIALLGLAWQKEMAFPLFWRGVLAIALIWQIYFFYWGDYSASQNKGLIGGRYGEGVWGLFIIGLIMGIQGLKIVALCYYSFPNLCFWQKLREMLKSKVG